VYSPSKEREDKTFLGDMFWKLESVSVEVLSPVMSTSTPGDEGETTEEPVVVVLLKFDEYNAGCHELS